MSKNKAPRNANHAALSAGHDFKVANVHIIGCHTGISVGEGCSAALSNVSFKDCGTAISKHENSSVIVDGLNAENCESVFQSQDNSDDGSIVKSDQSKNSISVGYSKKLAENWPDGW